MERRFLQQPIEVRKKDGGATIAGHAAVFYRESDPGTQFQLRANLYERIMPGAFNRAISEAQDVRALFNHDPSHLLGRSTAKTLRLSVDDTGLRYEIDIPDTSTGRDVIASIERGDLTGSSFGFQPVLSRTVPGHDMGADVRLLEDVNLFDVGPVTYPAYEATTTLMRSIEGYLAEYDAERRRRQDEIDAVAVRIRQIALDTQTQML